MTPTLKQLRYFVALTDSLHFGRAASQCNVTQPALSMQIRELEALLRVTLVERTPTGILLTTSGAALAERARAILLATHDLVDLAHQHAETCSGALRLGVIPTIGPYLLPRVLPPIHAAYPNLQLSLHERQTDHLVRDLAAGQLDLLILALPVERDDIATAALFRDEFAMALPANHNLAHHRVIRSADLASQRLLLLEEGHCLRDQAMTVARSAGASERDDFSASSLATIVQMVAGGYGSTILPRLAVPVEIGTRTGVSVVPFEAPPPSRTIGLAWRRSSPRRADFVALGEIIGQIFAGEPLPPGPH